MLGSSASVPGLEGIACARGEEVSDANLEKLQSEVLRAIDVTQSIGWEMASGAIP